MHVLQDFTRCPQKGEQGSGGQHAKQDKKNDHQQSQQERATGHGPDLIPVSDDHMARHQGTCPYPDSLSYSIQEHDDRKSETYGSQRLHTQPAQKECIRQVENHHTHHAKQRGPCKRCELCAYTAVCKVPVQLPHKMKILE
ncbi:MAG TPA: hypothetical protein PKY83_05870 [Bacteroidales bacterium]|nr:hypothetical protein [Bacteroidales bacterium]HNT48843.1 hypothetical protein [Bacteroidales bacterium]HNW22655.1 hypothetical protein [Bacteroidales bacterium]HOF75986.1 hypothetical protein [Bacteroidales bacterium]HOZ10457.1 hypothetical protein [Bacteroidales bacterium]